MYELRFFALQITHIHSLTTQTHSSVSLVFTGDLAYRSAYMQTGALGAAVAAGAAIPGTGTLGKRCVFR
jgi:hypothetical protein